MDVVRQRSLLSMELRENARLLSIFRKPFVGAGDGVLESGSVDVYIFKNAEFAVRLPEIPAVISLDFFVYYHTNHFTKTISKTAYCLLRNLT